MDYDAQRAVLEELKSHDLGFPVSARQIATERGMDFGEVVAAAIELERKMRIGHYMLSVINEYGPGEVLNDTYISMAKLDKLREKEDLTLRISGPQKFSPEQQAAIESLRTQFEGLGYSFHMPRVITASATWNAFEIVMIYLGMKAIDKATDRAVDKAIDEVIAVTTRTVKRLHQICRDKFQHEQSTTIIVINDDTKDEIARVEIVDDDAE